MRRPLLRTSLPGPQAAAVIQGSEPFISTSYTRDYPLVAASGAGCWITDPDGNEFLDMTSGIAVCSTGHCHPEIVATIQDQASKLIHMSGTDFYYPSQGELAKRLCPRVPVKGGNAMVYFCNSGAEANEAAIKLARWHTGRQHFLAFLNSFHGRTMGALALTSSKVRQKERFGPLMPGVVHSYYPDAYQGGGAEVVLKRALEHVQQLFDTILPAKEVAAIFVEPIQGEGGYVIPPKGFLEGLRAICDQHGILLVFDEVQSGMGRTGRLWACEHTGVQPDILTSAKGIASGLPLGAMFASGDLMKWPPGAHASTFGGNPIACSAAIKTLELLDRELLANCVAVGEHFVGELRRTVGEHANVGEIRGRGLMIGVELVKDRGTRERAVDLRNRVVQEAFLKGLLILGCGKNTVRFCPGLVITKDEATVAAEIFAEALAASAAQEA
jgi:4-aminobutyrate aminotransferase